MQAIGMDMLSRAFFENGTKNAKPTMIQKNWITTTQYGIFSIIGLRFLLTIHWQ